MYGIIWQMTIRTGNKQSMYPTVCTVFVHESPNIKPYASREHMWLKVPFGSWLSGSASQNSQSIRLGRFLLWFYDAPNDNLSSSSYCKATPDKVHTFCYYWCHAVKLIGGTWRIIGWHEKGMFIGGYIQQLLQTCYDGVQRFTLLRCGTGMDAIATVSRCMMPCGHVMSVCQPFAGTHGIIRPVLAVWAVYLKIPPPT